jgi:large exoprotein involved in heme utilization and adhesion
VEVGRLNLRGGGQISSTTAGIGNGGRVTVRAQDAITIAGRNAKGFASGIFSNTFGRGAAGLLSISAAALEIEEGGEISAGTFDEGPGGKIFVSASRIEVDDGLISVASRGGGNGNAGNITVQADRVRLTRGGQMISHTEGRGRGGALTLEATEAISIIGQNREGKPSGLISGTAGSGPIGRIQIAADELIIKGGLVDAGTPGEVRAGDIAVNARRVFLGRDDEGHQGRMTAGTTGTGAGGLISIAASDEVEIDGGLISTSSRGNGESATGDAGGITVGADRIHVTRGGQITSDTEGPGRGGNIQLTARQIRLQEGGTLSARSRGTGRAGNILLDVVERFESQGGAVTTESDRAGGGIIELTAGERVLLQDSTITTTVRGGEGDAGNIKIESPFVILNRSRVIANAFEGTGGNIHIVADHFLKSADSWVDASSSLGIDGTVEISAPETDLSGGLEALPADFFDAAALLKERCAVRGGRASLVAVGRGGTPPSPDGFLPSFQLARAGCSLVARDVTD